MRGAQQHVTCCIGAGDEGLTVIERLGGDFTFSKLLLDKAAAGEKFGR